LRWIFAYNLRWQFKYPAARDFVKNMNTFKKSWGALAALPLILAFASLASADTIDGFTVTINPFPAAAITTGLTPDTIVLNGDMPGSFMVPGINMPIDPYLGMGNLFDEGWEQGTPPARTNPWGATNPFENTALDGSEYDGIYDGVATYNYLTPQSSLTILWGTPSADNELEFLDQDGNQIGQFIDGASVLAGEALT
jgi:hypothetical protein